MEKVVVTDYAFPSLEIEEAVLKPLGCAVVGGQCKTPAELKALVADADCVITQFARIDAEVIGAMRKARVIVRYGIGVDNVDLQAAAARGIPVCNVPDYCMDEVADHTLAFILASTRQVVPHALGIRAGAWKLATPLTELRTLRDMTVGIIGFGRIGREVAARLAPFKCRLVVHDPLVPAAEVKKHGAEPVELDALFAASDLVTLHCPSTPKTKRIINADSLARMRKGAILVNIGRGDLADTSAVVEALARGHLAAAALDVCDPEPVPAGHPLLAMPNVIFSPHIASASPKAVRTLRETAAGIAATALRRQPLPNIVNGVKQ
jgi:D-3-phosphoglycerate dehydrogenase / 2-oxoglutarate reductase